MHCRLVVVILKLRLGVEKSSIYKIYDVFMVFILQIVIKIRPQGCLK